MCLKHSSIWIVHEATHRCVGSCCLKAWFVVTVVVLAVMIVIILELLEVFEEHENPIRDILTLPLLSAFINIFVYSCWFLFVVSNLKKVLVWNIFSWVFGMCLAAIFFLGDLIGPYKGLYCCVKVISLLIEIVLLCTPCNITEKSVYYYQKVDILCRINYLA